MPITNTFGRMALDLVWVERAGRQRREVDPEAGGLMQSIALRGVLMPVILEETPNTDGYHILYAGERRYAASLRLGLEDIPYRFARAPSLREIQLIEFEENAKRKDLTWQETARAVEHLHTLYVEDDPTWTLEATGRELGWVDGSYVARCMFVTASWHDEAVRSCGTLNEAYNLLQRRQRRAQQGKLDEWLGRDGPSGEGGDDTAEGNETDVDDSGDSDERRSGDGGGMAAVLDQPQPPGGASGTPAAPRVGGVSGGGAPAGTAGRVAPATATTLPILQADFLTWSAAYVGPKFNLVHCDFPYGIRLGESTHRGGSNSLTREDSELYSDTPEDYAALLGAFVANFARFASESCHVMFWYSNRVEIERATREALLRIPGFAFLRHPLIWHKSDNAGFMTPGNPRHVYETCLVGGRGDRPIVKYVSDCYNAPTDNSLHLSAKPEPMLRYFMGMFCDEHSRVLDPTCGGGSALRAAESLRAERVLGLEVSPEMARAANTELLKARALRRAAEGAKGSTTSDATP